jgi:phage terminase small subunit
MKSKHLRPKQELFVREYLVDLNVTRAAKAAGYSEKNCPVPQGWLISTNVDILTRIDAARGKSLLICHNSRVTSQLSFKNRKTSRSEGKRG